MEFEWDENKRLVNLRKHGIDFTDAVNVFDDDTVIIEDAQQNYGEQRWIAIGLLTGRVVVVVYTECRETIRIISVRKATKNEEIIYFKQISN